MTDVETAARWAKQHNVAEARYVHGKVCNLCGWKHGLKVFRHMGAPKINWSPAGRPSHRRFRIVCGDPTDCLRRQQPKPSPKPKPPVPEKTHKTGTAPTEKPTITGLAAWGPKRPAGPTKIEKDLTNVGELNGEIRFVCCGRFHDMVVSKRAFGF